MLLITNIMAAKMFYISVLLVFHSVIIFAIVANSEPRVLDPVTPNKMNFGKPPEIPVPKPPHINPPKKPVRIKPPPKNKSLYKP